MGNTVLYAAHTGQQEYGKGHYPGLDQHAPQYVNESPVAPQPGSNDVVQSEAYWSSDCCNNGCYQTALPVAAAFL